MMKIVFATSEMVPYAKTGGLADVCGSLPRELAALGHDVCAIIPRYKKIDSGKYNLKKIVEGLEVQVGNEKKYARVYSANHDERTEVFFIDCQEFFGRDELYGTPHGDYPDNDRRFIFYQRSVIEFLKVINYKPDILHCHDWQTGLLPVYLKTLHKTDPFFKKTKTVFTIHNLAYQGNFPPDSLPATGLAWDEFQIEKLEFYGKMSFMKGGIVHADVLTTVSERYAHEIQTKEFGCGLEGVLQKRKADLFGIINGLDYEEWNPETDPDLAATYSLSNLDKKLANKEVLQKENNLEVAPEIPLFGMVTRLADQKGLDILVPALADIAKLNAQVVILGTGDEKYHTLLKQEAKRFPKKFGINLMFDNRMAKRIYAGSDVFLMPSYYEPCGLGQLIAMRYGTVPLVRETGGLADTVTDYAPKSGDGTGFAFREYKSEALFAAVKRAVQVYGEKKAWREIMKRGMKADFSWKASAKKYVELYQQTERKTATA